jgi:hypothetical protein
MRASEYRDAQRAYQQQRQNLMRDDRPPGQP